MTTKEKEILKLLGFKECKLPMVHHLGDCMSYNGFLVTKHSYYWNLMGKVPYDICIKYNYKDIRFKGSSNFSADWVVSERTNELGSKMIDDLLDGNPKMNYEDIQRIVDNELYKDIEKGVAYIDSFHIDSLESFKEFFKEIKDNELVMIW